METEGAVVPPRAVSGRRYKAVMPWRFQPGFVRQQDKNPAAAAAAPRGSGGGVPVGGSGGKGCRSGPSGRRGGKTAGGQAHCQLRGGTRSATAKGGEKMEDGPPSGAKKDSQLKTGTPIVIVDSSDWGKMENGAPSGAEKDCQLKSGAHIVIIDSSDEDEVENGTPSVAKKDCQLKRATRSATAKSSNEVKMENGACSGAETDSQLKRHTRSAAAKSSDGEKMENVARSGAKKGCQSKSGTHSAPLKSSDGVKIENGAHSGAEKDCSLGKSSGNIMGGSVGTAAGADCGLEGVNCNGVVRDEHAHNFGTGGSVSAGVGASGTPEGIGSNAGAKNPVSEDLKKSCVKGSGKNSSSSAADLVLEEPEGNGGSMGKGAAKKSKLAAKGCSSAGHVGIDNVTYCRKGRKELVPWRFKIGYKRSFSKAFGSNNGSVETQECRAQGSPTQCTPGTRSTVRCYASPHSSVRVSAVRDLSSAKGEKETRTAYKKMKTNNDDHNQEILENGVSLARESVMRSLQDFRLIYKKVLDELEHKPKEGSDLHAYKIFRDRFFTQCDDKKYAGNVPGIHAGDIFYARVELCVVGLHRPHRLGIDHIKEEDGTCIAISIVAYAHFSDVKKNLDVLVYSGSLTTTTSRRIDGTNLALKKSMDTNTPVRVIHGFSIHTKGNIQRKKMLIYGGLYLVEKYWREKESDDRYVYMFRLRRIAGQKHVDIEEILKSGHAEPYDGVIIQDLSHGMERIPISVANSISDELPMPYAYISRLQYPRNYQPAPPAGCACVGGCSDSKLCACVVKNGGEIPFNDKGRIIVAKPLVYECGPSCKCPPTCYNRVGQKGMKFRLQVFKTKSMGWGVKTLEFIPSGSFVCEYIGEVLYDEEAQKRMTDEYLFAIGHNYYDEILWEGLSRSIPALQKGPEEDEDAGFAVDASKMGNFAKFINHSCTPNLYAQNVLYDHDDKSAPHIMFFACEDIPPCQELAYHYNYAIDQVYDANGNIKKKKCLCGSSECDGWLY
uniref:Uncharacterized protein n=1 Tax=Avena sativa TaxID=4498 RepID=A0ACD5V659_AVESA